MMKFVGTALHWIILALCLYSVGCCGFHILPVWGIASHYQDINTVLLGLSLSYIAAFIFYILLTWWPTMQKRKILLDVWKGDMENVYQYMGDSITNLMLYSGIAKKIDEIELIDCEPICDFDSHRTEVYYHVKYDVGKESSKHLDCTFRYHMDLQNNSDNVYRILDKMLQNPLTGYANSDLTFLLANIRDSEFVSKCRRMTSLQDKISVRSLGFDKAFFDYLSLYKKLGKYSFEKRTCEKTLLTDDEVVQFKQNVIEAKKASGMTDDQLREVMRILIGNKV